MKPGNSVQVAVTSDGDRIITTSHAGISVSVLLEPEDMRALIALLAAPEGGTIASGWWWRSDRPT